jgi:hypothetical protein
MKYKLLEIFKGTGSVGKVCKKMNIDVISLDIEEKYKPDIITDILEWDYIAFYKKYKFIPDFIWASPPCNTYSPLAYKLKERDIHTAEPLSKRASLGTEILYKTLEIIYFFIKINPNLLFVIENPHGMMRKDKVMKKLKMTTTIYSAYGDKKRKPTDFFNNLPQGLDLLPTDTKVYHKTMRVQDLKKLEDRYSIPKKLIRTIINQLIENY